MKYKTKQEESVLSTLVLFASFHPFSFYVHVSIVPVRWQAGEGYWRSVLHNLGPSRIGKSDIASTLVLKDSIIRLGQ
jgi:hypothetical protein